MSTTTIEKKKENEEKKKENEEKTIDKKIEKTYKPNWSSLDSRPIPQWYDKAKFGIFIHWGLYSVPAFDPPPEVCELVRDGSEWYQYRLEYNNPAYRIYHNQKYGAKFKYRDFPPMFTAKNWDPDAWTKTIAASGAKYVVFTTKHHDGFCNFPTDTSPNWNSVDVGPKRDIVAQLTAAVRKQGLRMGLYFSLYEWFNPKYIDDLESGKKRTEYVDTVMIPQIKTLITRYEPDILWLDGDWENSSEYWKSRQWLCWIFNEASAKVRNEILVNDRLGSDCAGIHGSFYNVMDRYTPNNTLQTKWENCETIGKSWGVNHQQKDLDFKSATTLIQKLVETVAKNGNLLLNIGPEEDGRLVPQEYQRLMEIGEWNTINGEAIFNTRTWSQALSPQFITVYFESNDAVSRIIEQHLSKSDVQSSSCSTIRLDQPNESKQETENKSKVSARKNVFVRYYTMGGSNASGNVLYSFFMEWPQNDVVFVPINPAFFLSDSSALSSSDSNDDAWIPSNQTDSSTSIPNQPNLNITLHVSLLGHSKPLVFSLLQLPSLQYPSASSSSFKIAETCLVCASLKGVNAPMSSIHVWALKLSTSPSPSLSPSPQ